MENNAWLFTQRIILNNSEENFYYDFPILKEIDSNTFAEKICNVSRDNSKYILSGLDRRYSIQASFNMYTEENNIKVVILPSADKIFRAKINLYILPNIVQIKKSAVTY